MSGQKPEDPALLDLDSTREAHARLIRALEDVATLSPEASALRTVLASVSEALDLRNHRALDSNHAERELQFLIDLRDVANGSLSACVPFHQKGGLTWQRIGDLLRMSRQAAHERYSVRAVRNTRQ